MLKIGLECHSRLKLSQKLFSESTNCALLPPARSNQCISNWDIGYPGVLPVLNKNAIHLALRACMLLSCEMTKCLKFDRKHYVYKDLPLGYQITQHENPIGFNGTFLSKSIRRVQLENDTARVIDETDGTAQLDFNRSGIALLEIVTEPEFSTIQETIAFASSLNAKLVKYAVIDRNIEDGSFRIDANMNLIHNGIQHPKVELKNIMGFRFLQQALEFEYARQLELLRTGNSIQEETRMFSQKTGQTISMREKTNSAYLYVPEHDINPIQIAQSEIQLAQIENDFYERLFSENIPKNLLFQLEHSANAIDLYVNMKRKCPEIDPSKCIHWICNDILRLLNSLSTLPQLQQQYFHSQSFSLKMVRIFQLTESKQISKMTAKYIVREILLGTLIESIDDFVKNEDLFLVLGMDEIANAIESFKIINHNSTLSDFMKSTKGRYCPEIASKLFSCKMMQR